jgi:hypothetical protein
VSNHPHCERKPIIALVCEESTMSLKTQRACQDHFKPEVRAGANEAIKARHSRVAVWLEAQRGFRGKTVGSRSDGLACFYVVGTMEITLPVRTSHGFSQSNIERRFAGVS